MKLADIITASRIVFSAIMAIVTSFSGAFWSCYICAGLSDLLDGFVARKMRQQSEAGARLDSIADLVFAASIAFVVVKSFDIPLWLWLLAISTALLRFASYGVGFCKFRRFSALHTYLNKAAGFLIFAFPLLYAILGFKAAATAVCAVSFLSAAEELAIIVRLEKLDRDRKGLFVD